jgi:hypothetical protein
VKRENTSRLSLSEKRSAILHDSSSVHARIVTPVLFTLAILLSAGLLFFIQPLLTRMVTPLIGGAPGVWTTAALFFQTMMIGGYLYAHLLTRLPRIRHQVGVHLLVWLVASTFLPLAVQDGWIAGTDTPIQIQTLMLYAVTVGVPFFFLSANAPLIQTWYGRTRGPSAHDPYFLYGASNVGSLIALIGFPLIAEPFIGVAAISMGWSIGFILIGALIFISAFWTTRDHPDAKTVLPIKDKKSDMRTLFTWGVIAFVPSSLMLAVTTKITTDFGSFPLLWVIPLAIYLMTYVAGFHSRPIYTDKIMDWLYPVSIAAISITGMTHFFGLITVWSAGIMVVSFAFIALHLHRELYRMRPDPSRLTIFYLTLSIGGAAGGLFNAVIAPVLMDGMYEFPLTVIVAAAVILLRKTEDQFIPNSVIGVSIIFILLALLSVDQEILIDWGTSNITIVAIMAGCMMLVFNPMRSAGVTCIMTACSLLIVADGEGVTIHSERNFFGIHKVIDNGTMRAYLNGTTLHGAHRSDEMINPEPLFYYRKDGPLGDIAETVEWTGSDTIGLVGLGTGAMLKYRGAGQHMSIYEIDPEVIRIATDPKMFGFVSSYGDMSDIHLGDARIVLEQQEYNEFGVLIIDAYSSDAVPMHLSTVEAMDIFMEDVAPDGVLVYHISNRYFDLTKPLGGAAAKLGLRAYNRHDQPVGDQKPGFGSKINALAIVRPGYDHDFITEEGSKWIEVDIDPSLAWSDDSSSPITALK